MDNTIENKDLKEALDTLMLGAEISTAQIDYLAERFSSIADYFNTKCGDNKEKDLEKLVVAALIEANDKGILSFPNGMRPEEVASRVNQSLTKSKTRYLYEKGKLNEEESFNYLLDDAAANIIAIADKFVEESTPLLSSIISTAVVSIFPEVAPLAPVIKQVVDVVVKQAVPWIKKVIHIGIKTVSSFFKNVNEEFAQLNENTQSVQQKQVAMQ